MALLSMTVTATVQVLGASPPDLWNSYNWNSFKWGAGTDTIPKIVVQALNGQSVTPSVVNDFRVVRLLTAQTVTLSSVENSREVIQVVEGSVSPSDAMAHIYLMDSKGYFHVFAEGVTDALQRSVPTWSTPTSTAVAWTTASVGVTTWS